MHRKGFLLFTLLIFLCLSLPSHSAGVKFIETNGIKIWTESFGFKKDPAILLISGGGAGAIMWPDLFCHRLVEEGFFVLRYDPRGMGYSSSVEAPYDLLDMAKDALAVLDAYGVKRAHLLGAGSGSGIAMLLGRFFPERISSLMAMMATSDLNAVL